MESTTRQFHANTRKAIADEHLKKSLNKLGHNFPEKRRLASERLPEFEQLRDQARDIKNHVLGNLDYYLQTFEGRVRDRGGEVHWCQDSSEAQATILEICRSVGAKTVTKSKSMIGEEIGINEFLEQNDVTPIETDLGEYIIQLRQEPPSHIIAPAIHLSQEQVAETFVEAHKKLDKDRSLEDPHRLLEEARAELREKFITADVGLTGANMLIAETGSNVLVTNEGNADLTYGLPKVHIVIASLEKVVPNLEDATTILRVLARSATGQEMAVYTSLCTGIRLPDDLDGPDQYHVVLLDNGRTDLLGSEFEEMLRCIRCGACLNHCPVYQSIGGHAYGWVYSGPMGAVLIPGLIGMDEAYHLPNASTLCGRCESVCPMRIPLPKMLRSWRKRQFEANLNSKMSGFGLAVWSFLINRPGLFRLATGLVARVMSLMAGKKGRLRWLPMAGGWTGSRDMPAPQGKTFMQQWHDAKELDSKEKTDE